MNTMQPAENLTKEQELALGGKIQKMLSADSGFALEAMSPEESLEHQEHLNRGLAALNIDLRKRYSSALAAHLNGESVKALLGWVSAMEYFTAADVEALQQGWSDSFKADFKKAMDKSGYVISDFADVDGMSNATRKRAQAEGKRAATALVRSYFLLVRNMAHEFKRKMPASPDHDEIFAMGLVGLWKAALKYDPRRGNKFSTVAFSWVRQSIVREINNTHRLVRLPENRVGNFIDVSKLRRETKDMDLTESQFEDLVTERLGLTREKIREINNAAGNHASLNKNVGDGEGEKELIHYVAKSAPAAEEIAAESGMKTILNIALQALDPLSLEVVVSSFKLDYAGIPHRTVREICADADISPSQYRRISATAMKKVREQMENDYGVTFADFFG